MSDQAFCFPPLSPLPAVADELGELLLGGLANVARVIREGEAAAEHR